jgi:hypothetical protein
VRPSALAVLRLMTRSNLVGCSTGSSAGFAPLALQKKIGRPPPQGQTCSPDRDRLPIQQKRRMADATARVHRGARWRSGVAARGANAAARPLTANRRADGVGRKRSHAKGYLSAFTQALAGLGWTDGRNMRIDVRFRRARMTRIRARRTHIVEEMDGIRDDALGNSF